MVLFSQYSAVIKGRTYEGKCADLSKTSKIDGLSDMDAWGLIIASHLAYKFDQGEYYNSLNRGESFKYSMDTYRMDGDRVVMVDKYGNDIPEKKSGLMTYRNGMLTILHYSEDGQITITYRRG